MSGDLLYRLRKWSEARDEFHRCIIPPDMLVEAADEIASLRAQIERLSAPSPAGDDAGRLRNAAKLVFEAWDAHALANERTNAAIPAIDATRAEREVYDERYRSSEEAKRKWYRSMHRFIETPNLRAALSDTSPTEGEA